MERKEYKNKKYQEFKNNTELYNAHISKNREKLSQIRSNPEAYQEYLKKQKQYRDKYRNKVKQDHKLLSDFKQKSKIYKKTQMDKIKADPIKLEKFVNYNKEYKKQYKEDIKQNDPFRLRFYDLLKKAKEENVKCEITKEELEQKLIQSSCYLTGKSIAEDIQKTTYAYYLDRIGKKEYGGNGIGGGDYVWGNVEVCIFSANEMRGILGLSSKKAKLLFFPARIYWNTEKFIKKIKKMLKFL